MGCKAIDISDKKFYRWTVISRSDIKSSNGQIMWSCKCDCGTVKNIPGGELRRGKTKSCGCYRDDFCSIKSQKHGYRYHKLYNVWRGMIRRCYNKNAKNYHRYGGRGIIVCDEWKDDKIKFIEWGLKNGWKNGLQIDREDNDDNYRPLNCRFVTPKVNSRNSSLNKRYHFGGLYITATEASEIYNINRSTLYNRLLTGKYTPLEAATLPLQR